LTASNALVGLVAGKGGCIDSSSSSSDSSSLDSGSSEEGVVSALMSLALIVVGVSERPKAGLGAGMVLPFFGFFDNFAIVGEQLSFDAWAEYAYLSKHYHSQAISESHCETSEVYMLG